MFMDKIERNYDFRKQMLCVHKKNIRDFSLLPSENEFQVLNKFEICIPADANEVIVTAAQDLVSYLLISMGISAFITKGTACVHPNKVVVSISNDPAQLGDANGYKGFKAEVDDNGIQITGFDDRGVAQGLYFIEEMMTLRRAPLLKKEINYRKPMFSPCMVHSGYGLDEYPDEHLQAIAHEGRDAILVFVKGVNMTPYGYLDFNELIHRAARYGIDVYAYSYLKSDMHPDDKGAEAYYDSSYGELFRSCPRLKGIVMVGESVGFPSKDPHVAPDHKSVVDKDGLPLGKPRSGWWPCQDFPQWLSLIKKVIRKHSDDAEIILWTYNWGRQPVEERVRLINELPEGIVLQSCIFEKVAETKIEDIKILAADYTIQAEGPTFSFVSEAEAAAKRGIKLYTMTNTGGLTWDFGVIPYEPFPYQWMRRFAAMREANTKYGLVGIMESHHYGIYPSFISKLAKWSFNDSKRSLEEILDDVLVSEFGEGNLNSLKEALSLWSEAIRHYTPTDPDQYGAFRIGPAYPFCLLADYKNPDMPYAMFGNRIYFSNYEHMYPHEVFQYRGTPFPIRVPAEIRSLEKMLSLMSQGIAIMESMEHKNDALLRLMNMVQFMVCTIKTGIASKKWYKLRHKYHTADTKEELICVLDAMEVLLNEEIKNSEAAIPLVERDSRLGWEPSMEYMGDRAHIEWKIKHAKYVINSEIASSRSAIYR